MKTFILKALILLALPLVAATVHAQVYPCSGPGPGQIVVGQTQGGQGVASQPLCQRVQQQQRPPEQWANRSGAIATDATQGVLGVASNMTDKDMAESYAMSECKAKGGTNCIMQIWYTNQCVAMVVGGKIFNVNSGATIALATEKGMQQCRTAASDCHVYYSACSLPVRIQ